MKLQQKALLLVLLPLLFDISFVGLLLLVVNRSEAESRKLLNTQALLMRIDRLMRFGFELSSSTIRKQLSTESAVKRIHSIKAQATDKKEVLATLVDFEKLAQTSENRERCLALARTFRSFMDTLDAIKLGNDLPPWLEVVHAVDQEEPLLNRTLIEMKELEMSEEAAAREAVAEESKYRKLAQQVVLLGICVNVSLSIFLTVFFYRSTTTRLYKVLKNTVRLANHLPLEKPEPGSDEIAELAATFFSSGVRLQELEVLKQNMIEMVSHDIRAPLTAMLTNLQLVADGTSGKLTTEAEGRLIRVERNAQMVLELVNDLLDLERIQSGGFSLEKERIDTRSLIMEAIETVEEQAKKADLTIESQVSVSHVFADGLRIKQVLVNLIGNALKFSPAGSKILINTDEDQRNTIFEVVDQGRGIEPHQLDEIFEKFAQAKHPDAMNSRGVGLGLALCKAIVELHGGSIGARSAGVDLGSTFWFTLPKQSS